MQQPVMQHRRLILIAHLELIVLQDLNEVAHDVGEEGDAREHYDHGEDPFGAAYWVKVAVADCAQRGQGVVAADYQLFLLCYSVFNIQGIVLDEIVGVGVVGDLIVAKVPPGAPDEVRDDHGDDDQSQDLVDVQKEVVLHDSLVSRRVAHQRLEQLVEAGDVDELYQSRQPKQPKQLGHITLSTHEHLKWKHGDEVDEEPAVKDVVLRYALQVLDDLEGLGVLVALQEV